MAAVAGLRWRKDRRRWQLTVSLGADEHGTYRRATRMFDGPPPTKNGNPPRRVLDDARDIEAKLARHAIGEPASFGALCEAWLQEWSQLVELGQRSPTTAARYEGIVRTTILPSQLARKRVRDVTVGDLDRWYLHLQREGLTGSSVHQVHSVVRQALKMAARNEWVAGNVAALAQRPPAETEERRRPSVAEVVEVLVAAAAVEPARARAMRFAALTGLRRGEMAGLRWSRVSTSEGKVLVDANVVWAQGRQHVKAPKGRKARLIPISAAAAAIVEAQQAWQLDQCREAEVRPAKDPWLWAMVEPFEEPLVPAHLTEWMEAARKVAGHEWMRLHDLRHYTGSQLGDAVARVPGASRADVQRLLRHAQPETTNRYLHAEEDDTVRRRLLDHVDPLELPPGDQIGG